MPSRKRDEDSEERFESADDEDVKPKVAKRQSKQANVAKPTSAETVNMEENEQGEQYLKLSETRRLTVRTFKERVLVDIREFYKDKQTGELKPGSKGISLTKEQWETLKGAITDVDGAVEAIESKKK